MNVGADWKGLYELLNDLIRQEDVADLEASLSGNIDSLIPADRGAAFFKYQHKHPKCVRWPEYTAPLVPDFNAHYSRVCPVSFRLQDLMLGPVSWSHYRNSEYDTDFNRPLHIGHSMGCGFPDIYKKYVHIIVLNRGRGGKAFSGRDVRDFRRLTELFAELYRRIEHTDECIESLIRQVNMQPGMIPLSPRETEICVLLCRQCTAREIGELLGISPRTVERHCFHIYYKMNVAGRNELMNLVFTAGA